MPTRRCDRPTRTFGLETSVDHRPQVLAFTLKSLAEKYGFHLTEFPPPAQSYATWFCELLIRSDSEAPPAPVAEL